MQDTHIIYSTLSKLCRAWNQKLCRNLIFMDLRLKGWERQKIINDFFSGTKINSDFFYIYKEGNIIKSRELLKRFVNDCLVTDLISVFFLRQFDKISDFLSANDWLNSCFFQESFDKIRDYRYLFSRTMDKIRDFFSRDRIKKSRNFAVDDLTKFTILFRDHF